MGWRNECRNWPSTQGTRVTLHHVTDTSQSELTFSPGAVVLLLLLVSVVTSSSSGADFTCLCVNVCVCGGVGGVFRETCSVHAPLASSLEWIYSRLSAFELRGQHYPISISCARLSAASNSRHTKMFTPINRTNVPGWPSIDPL